MHLESSVSKVPQGLLSDVFGLPFLFSEDSHTVSLCNEVRLPSDYRFQFLVFPTIVSLARERCAWAWLLRVFSIGVDQVPFWLSGRDSNFCMSVALRFKRKIRSDSDKNFTIYVQPTLQNMFSQVELSHPAAEAAGKKEQ